MKKLRTKSASFTLMLGCLAAWTALGHAQIDLSPLPRPTQSTPPSSSGERVAAPGIGSNLATQTKTKTAKSTNDWRLPNHAGEKKIQRQVVSLILPESDATEITTNRQTVDLRELSAHELAAGNSEPTGRVPARLAGGQEETRPGSEKWVDLAIPKKYFEDAKISPRTTETPSSKPTLPIEASRTETNQTEAKSRPADVNRTQPVDSAVPSPPVAPRTIAGASEAVPGRVPGQTFTPDQAIPTWILPNGGQASPSAPRPTNSAQPAAETQRQTEQALPEHSQSSIGSNNNASAGNQLVNAPASPNTSSNSTPEFTPSEHHPSFVDAAAGKVVYSPEDFSPALGSHQNTFDPDSAAAVYRGKFAVPVQRPWIELWRPLYTSGIYPPAPTWFGVTNPMKPHFLVYGDMRSAVGINRNANGQSNVWGNVLNLDMDLQLTSTERIHAFVSPLNRAAQATGLQFNDDVDVVDATNFNFNTLFFEGDMGALLGGATGQFPRFDLPFTLGLIPLIYQNGIWANDAVLGAAFALPARNSRALKWSNFDATFFWATDNITTNAFPNQDSAADFFGTAWFIDAYEGYVEADYAFVNDNTGAGLSYHNLSVGFTRRYLSRLSNSVRYIVNMGQGELNQVDRTADGHLLLIENSLVTSYPTSVVPYLNFFYGQGRPQSLARAGVAGGVLNNTGINFETDGITGYPTLDATGNNTFGFASGVNLLGSQFSHQLILELAMVKATGPQQLRSAEGDQYAVGMRYQKPLNHCLIFRTDHMVGFREGADNLNGSRFELRWKF